MTGFKKTDIEIPNISRIRINKENIYKALGMTEDDSDEHLSLLIDQYVDKGRKLCKPCLCFQLYDEPRFNVLKGELYLHNHTFNLGKKVAASLAKSSQVILFTVTCGDSIEKFSKNLIKEGHMLEGLIVDIIGSELADELAEYLHHSFEQEAIKYNLNTTNRYSPGYCNWPVSDQQNLFALMNGNHCGIELTASSLMIPIKSVSGIIGIGEGLKKQAYKCQLCDNEKCLMRNNNNL